MKAAIETAAADAPAVRVRFLGFQNQTQLSRYYHAADLRRLIEQILTPEDEELTPTMKLKRRGVHDRYADAIADLYA